MKARTPGRTESLTAWALAIALGCGLTMAGCRTTEAEAPEVPETPPTASAQVTVDPVPEEPSSADLWSNDRSRTDTPLLGTADLDPEIQWAIFTEVCGQDPDAFCALMAIAYTESRYTANLVGDDGKSVGMMQINTK